MSLEKDTETPKMSLRRWDAHVGGCVLIDAEDGEDLSEMQTYSSVGRVYVRGSS